MKTQPSQPFAAPAKLLKLFNFSAQLRSPFAAFAANVKCFKSLYFAALRSLFAHTPILRIGKAALGGGLPDRRWRAMRSPY